MGVTNRVTPGKVILGRLGDIEAGVRQMIRSTPLEVAEVVLPSGAILRAPTPDETLRVKGSSSFAAIKHGTFWKSWHWRIDMAWNIPVGCWPRSTPTTPISTATVTALPLSSPGSWLIHGRKTSPPLAT